MANAFAVYSLPLRQEAHGVGTLTITDDLICEGEAYIGDPQVYGNCKYGMDYGSSVLEVEMDILNFDGQTLHPEYLRAFYIREYKAYQQMIGDNWFCVSSRDYTGNVANQQFNIKQKNSSYTERGRYEFYAPSASYNMIDYVTALFATNIPIFETLEDANTYLHESNPDIRLNLIKTKAINYKGGDIVPDTIEYFYYGVADNITMNEYGETTPASGSSQHRGFKLRIPEGRASLYVEEGVVDGTLWFNINIGDTPLIAYYSYDCDVNGNGTWQEMEYAPTTLPFSRVYRYSMKEVGTYYCAGISKPYKTFNTNLPIYGTKEESDAYNADGSGLEDAINYNEIANYYGIDNPTGIEDDLTEFGENFTRSFFTQCYLCNTGAVQEISNNLFDYDVTTLSGIWEDIKKGLEMYGSNPMDVVQGLRFYPFDLSQIFTNLQSQNYIYFGAYQLQLQNSSVYKVIYANGYKDLGTVSVRRTFNDWRDFEPYTKLSIYLPYIGRYPLKAERYYGKQVNIRYYIDIRTGLACACLIADGVLLDWFDGQIGTEMPITLTDYASYSQTQINTILRNATLGIGAEGAVGNIGVKSAKNAMQASAGAEAAQADPLGSSLAAQTATKGSIGWTIGGFAAAGALVGTGVAMKTTYDLMKTGTAANTSVKGSSSSMINSFLPQYPTFMFEILEIDESPYLNELYGRPSNASGRIADFSGYLEAEDIMLICPIATDSERQEIIDLVRSGIYI